MKITSVSSLDNCSKLQNLQKNTKLIAPPQRPARFKTRVEVRQYLEKVKNYYKSKDIKSNDVCKNQIIKLKKLDSNNSTSVNAYPGTFSFPVLMRGTKSLSVRKN